ncbi:MAG TPA: NIPSNAP family protein [Candidatus Aquilonibacter sp.]|nr:NIPSNAP family protein [Candidatus Aquilonibacter sp.]
MDRRKFLGSALGSGAALAASTSLRAAQETAGSSEREYYELRRYHILSGPMKKLADDYFKDALIPALNRLDIKPVGVFNTSIGAQGPSSYVLMPAAKSETLVTAEARLRDDADYQKAGADYLNAPARDPGAVRMESSLLYAFEAMPKLAAPPTGPRMFEMRTYESTTMQDHLRKVEMMNAGEVAIFKKSSFWPVFMGDRVIGERQPGLTYMISFPTLADRDKNWAAFFGSPEWKALTSNPRYSFEPIVSNVDNEILAPAAYSQI